MRFRKFTSSFDTEDRLSITIDDIARPLSSIQSSFEGGKVPSEFVAPLTKFAERYGGGSFSSLFAEGKSARQKQKLVEEFGSVLYSMETEEVKNEETFLIWRDACRDIIDWGLKVDFMLDHLKQAARDFFGYMLRPSGSESSCREIIQMEEAISQLRKKLLHLEQKLGEAREDLHLRLGDDISSDSMSCILGSSWVPQSRASRGLY
ncbi:uncharacterized protein LOC133741739 [Rosa rugosa]|uniref:uncharacterized protein LOC133741739 n=1 Tax=Rosa rugosa TaxID=74645 RepID=UPI002B40125F|nr:uncharacterized protein LOC133741739 [Rosa rugosa]